jgi:hypothetical protein
LETFPKEQVVGVLRNASASKRLGDEEWREAFDKLSEDIQTRVLHSASVACRITDPAFLDQLRTFPLELRRRIGAQNEFL